MKKIVLVISFMVCAVVQGHVQPEDLRLVSGPILEYFVAAEKQDALLSYTCMNHIFSELPQGYRAQRKLIRKDIQACREFIKKHAPQSDFYHHLLQELLALSAYVKKYKSCSEAIQFHNQVKQRHQFAFNNPDIVHAVETEPALYGVESYKYKCRAYFNKVSNDLRKVDRFEDTIHGNYGELKAHNYVYKIELITIRNYIYHDNIYKFETRYF